MKTSRILTFSIVLVFLFAGSALAVPFNVRPVNGLNNLGSLQNYLENEKGQNINVYDDQNGTAIWQTTDSEVSTFTLMIEMTADTKAEINSFGIYNDGDTGTLFQVFEGPAVGKDDADPTDPVNPTYTARASVVFNADGVDGKLAVQRFDGSTFNITNIYYGVSSSAFGFYMDSSGSGSNGGIFFSEDDENTLGAAQNLVYAGTGNSAGQWWLAWEQGNRGLGLSDSDFDDMIVFAESINPAVPEPATILLFGAGLLGLAVYGRKKGLGRA